MFAERAAKRERRPKRARAMVEEETPSAGQRYYTKTHTLPTQPSDQLTDSNNLDLEKVPSRASK